MKFRGILVLAALLTILVGTSEVRAAEPTIRILDIRSLRIGGTTTLTIDGDDFGKTPRLVLPFKAKQELKPGATDKKAAFDVTLGPEIEPGYYHLRLVSESGVSAPVVIGVDRIRQQLVTEPIKELPVALHGAVAGGSIVETKFTGNAKQRIMVEVEAQRLGAKLRPVVHLYGPKKLQVAWAWGAPTLFGDCRLEATLPDDGIYTVTLHDAEYAAPAPSFFRLKIGEWSRVEQVFPPAIPRDQAWTIGLQGTTTPVQMTVKAPNGSESLRLPWPKGDNWSGPRPFLQISPHAEFVEAPKSDKLQEIPEGPAGVSGQLLTPYEEDRYRVAVKPNSKVKFEVFAERIGSPIDVALVVRNEKGDQLARAEDSPGTLDPVLEYTVPDKVTAIVVGIVDAQGRASPRGIYRLVIDPQGTVKNGFKLTTTTQQISLPRGGFGVVPIVVDRRGGYTGSIDLFPDPLLRGFSMNGATIAAGADGALVTFERLDSGTEPIVMSLRGRAEKDVQQTVFIKNHPMERLQPWLATEFALGHTEQLAKEFAIDWRDLKPDAGLVPASRFLLPVKLTRPESKTTVKLTLLTSQNTPLVNNQPDANKALRQDKLGELAAKVDTGDVTVLVPADMSATAYDVTVQAELLDAAKKPIAVAYAPVKRLQVIIPIAVKLDGPSRIEAPFDAKKGATVKIQGKVERKEGVKADIALALTGLPAGAKAEAITVKGDATAFTLNVTFPPTVPPGEIKGVKLSGSYAPDAKLANVRVRSREIEMTLVLQAPPK